VQRTGRPYFIDNPREDIRRVANELSDSNPKLAHELMMDYDNETLNEAGGLLYSTSRNGNRIKFSRNKFEDLSIDDQIRVLKDNIDGYDGLLQTVNLSNAELETLLKSHNPNKYEYADLLDIFHTSVDSQSGIYSGPGQVGSPSRHGGKHFKRNEAIRNAAQFLSEPPTDRLTGTHVSFPQQGHVADAVNYVEKSRDLSNFRGQQAEPNRRDGAAAKGLVKLSREENLKIGKENEINKLLELIDERLSEDITTQESMNLLQMARDISGKTRFADASVLDEFQKLKQSALQEVGAKRDAQAAGAVVGEKPTVINAGEGSRVYVEGSNGNGNGHKVDKIKAAMKNGNGNGKH
jgi:hypothetical protein